MKIIKAADIDNWKYEHTCTSCDTVLEVHTSDLHHRTVRGDRPGEPDWDQIYANCMVCSAEFTVPEGKLTKAVKFKAKQRSRPTGNYFDR